MLRTCLFLGAAFALLACGNPSTNTADEIVGTYRATTFVTEEGDNSTDQLALGASITLTLNSDETTDGRLLVPGGAEDGSDFDVDLAGTWQVSSTQLTLAHAADTFLRDMSFTVDEPRLNGNATFSGVTIRVVLSK